MVAKARKKAVKKAKKSKAATLSDANAKPVSITKRGSEQHQFGRSRPSHAGNHPISVESERDMAYRPFENGPGAEPFRLDLKDVISAADYRAIVNAGRLTFHLNGDMGGIKYAVPQELVAKGMEQDFNPTASAALNPAFLYITGDCVYFNGEVEQYYAQFYEPYEFYRGPIFAVPGNHDGENLPNENSLDGFRRNFCQRMPIKMPESKDSNRTAMTQPNVYWTLLTPLVNIIGLYSNVPSGGAIKEPQMSWLTNELKTLPKNKPVFVALHHPVYSADDHHSGSLNMKEAIEKASAAAGRAPHMILAGHVHNYQRLTHKAEDGTVTPHLVTGAGGYHNLHHIMKVEGRTMIPPVTFTDQKNQDDPVTLERYSADHHGFLRVEVTDKLVTGQYYEVPRPQEPWGKGNTLVDYFEFDWTTRQYQPNKLITG